MYASFYRHSYVLCINLLESIQRKNNNNRPLSHGGQFESQESKKLCFCPPSLTLDERLDGQNLLFQHCMIKTYYYGTKLRCSTSTVELLPTLDISSNGARSAII